MHGLIRAWGFYIAGAITVLFALWLYARRLSTNTSVDELLDIAAEDVEHDDAEL